MDLKVCEVAANPGILQPADFPGVDALLDPIEIDQVETSDVSTWLQIGGHSKWFPSLRVLETISATSSSAPFWPLVGRLASEGLTITETKMALQVSGRLYDGLADGGDGGPLLWTDVDATDGRLRVKLAAGVEPFEPDAFFALLSTRHDQSGPFSKAVESLVRSFPSEVVEAVPRPGASSIDSQEAAVPVGEALKSFQRGQAISGAATMDPQLLAVLLKTWATQTPRAPLADLLRRVRNKGLTIAESLDCYLETAHLSKEGWPTSLCELVTTAQDDLFSTPSIVLKLGRDINLGPVPGVLGYLRDSHGGPEEYLADAVQSLAGELARKNKWAQTRKAHSIQEATQIM